MLRQITLLFLTLLPLGTMEAEEDEWYRQAFPVFWNETIQNIEQISDASEKARRIEELMITLTTGDCLTAEQMEELVPLFESLEDEESRTTAGMYLTMGALRVRKPELAKKIVDETFSEEALEEYQERAFMSDPPFEEWLASQNEHSNYSNLLKKIAQKTAEDAIERSDFETAEKQIPEVDSWEQQRIWLKMSEKYREQKNYDRALDCVMKMSMDGPRAAACEALVGALLREGRAEDAIRAAENFRAPSARFSALTRNVSVLFENALRDPAARKTLDRVLAYVDTIPESDRFAALSSPPECRKLTICTVFR